MKEETLEHPYFTPYEHRTPPQPIVKSVFYKWAFRCIAFLYVAAGSLYFSFRVLQLLNASTGWHIVIFSAEVLLFIGSIFRLTSYWGYQDTTPQRPIHLLSEVSKKLNKADRPIRIAIFIASHNESEALLEYTFQDVQQLTYPFDDVEINAYLLDDGQRPNLQELCSKYEIQYIGKPNNDGYKAGNLNYAFQRTQEDFIVILDADTRPFPDMMGHLTGYFREQQVAWVQSPQWYYDLSEPMLPSVYGKTLFKKTGGWLGKFLDIITFKKLYVNKDIYASNPRFFYDAILRNRNPYNGVFSCGAGSIYRRSALENFALKNGHKGHPFLEHISEDIYTSLAIHATTDYTSVYHHHYECKMLSPQDTSSWVKQQSRYARGAIDMGIRDNALVKPNLTWIQRILYFSVFYNFFTPLLAYVFFAVPILYFSLGITSIPQIDTKFWLYFLPFQSFNLLVFIIANKGISTKRPDQKFWNSFFYVTQSWIQVIKGKKLSFHVTNKKSTSENGIKHIIPHLLVFSLMFFTPIVYFCSGKNMTITTCFYLFWSIYFIFQLNQFIRMWIWDRVKLKVLKNQST